MGETFWRRWSCFVQPRDISVLSSVLSSYGSFPLIYVLPQLIHSEILKYETTQLMYNIFILVFSLSLSLSLCLPASALQSAIFDLDLNDIEASSRFVSYRGNNFK